MNCPPIWPCKKWLGISRTLSCGSKLWQVNGQELKRDSTLTNTSQSHTTAQVAFLPKLKAEYLSRNASQCALFSFLHFFGRQFDASLSVVSTAQVVQHLLSLLHVLEPNTNQHSGKCLYIYQHTQSNTINLYLNHCCFIHTHDW